MTEPISHQPVRPTPTRQDSRDVAKARAAAPSPPAPRAPANRPSASGTSGPVSADAGERRLRERPNPRAADQRDARIDRRPDGAALDGEAADLARVARRTRGRDGASAARAWDPRSDDLSKARNAHHSNTPEEMRQALEGDHDWLEGDLRVARDGRLVMAHDADEEDAGLELQEWLAIGAAGQRGLKVDVKEDEAIPELLDQLEASGIPQGRIMLNVGPSTLDEAGVRDVRRRFPDAWIALNPRSRGERGHGARDLQEITAVADAAGGRIAFPIRWDLASDSAIEALRPHGRVSIWTSSSHGTPDDAAAETAKLRERGVDGVIDLGPPSGTFDKVQQRAVDMWESGPVRGARELGGDAADLLGDVAGGARDIVGDAPIIGRWL